ncbi:iron-sulfur cluster assembly scaffold protein [Portibacter marinus]|uniref:iron-sulfur cluster assembly scaffold protein n=1 Tax=Portibacter marinus TaxID=2898660 RepID=UPI001F19AB14|nr:iron-sulfur cluster assembly scaffold protein [Portibacter marinus]
MSRLNKMYQEQLLVEAKNPYHFDKRIDIEESIRAYNPLCGDRYDLFLGEEIFFHGFGCAISKASTSLMIKFLEGKSNEEAIHSIKKFIKGIEGGGQIEEELLLIFRNPDHFKGRHDCIKLSWNAMLKYLLNLPS